MLDLTKMEEVLMIAVLDLKDEAYGVKIRSHVSRLIHKDMTYGNMYSTLNQLVRKKYLDKTIGEPTPERRGRPKTYYRITPAGKKTLIAAREMNQTLWARVPKIAL